jgi:hypothetical protein
MYNVDCLEFRVCVLQVENKLVSMVALTTRFKLTPYYQDNVTLYQKQLILGLFNVYGFIMNYITRKLVLHS